jgi:hypothetical protein
MKTIYFFVFALILFACNSVENPIVVNVNISSPNNILSGGVLTGKWKLIAYSNLTLGTIETEPTDISRSVIIDFLDDGAQGKMGGVTVTNSVGGEYELLKGNKMKTLIFYGSKVWEPAWGSKFWGAMNTASSYERQSSKLFIYFNADTEKIELEKK